MDPLSPLVPRESAKGCSHLQNPSLNKNLEKPLRLASLGSESSQNQGFLCCYRCELERCEHPLARKRGPKRRDGLDARLRGHERRMRVKSKPTRSRRTASFFRL